jgi:hypothetical protein
VRLQTKNSEILEALVFCQRHFGNYTGNGFAQSLTGVGISDSLAVLVKVEAALPGNGPQHEECVIAGFQLVIQPSYPLSRSLP